VLFNKLFVALILASIAPSTQLHAQTNEAVSDLLIVMDPDGRSHTVQHTLASNGPLLTLRLPGSVVPLHVQFLGADKQQNEKTFEINPNTVELSSGSAFARYQHQYGDEVKQTENGQFVLNTQSIPNSINSPGLSLTIARTTWVFPNTIEIVSYTIPKPSVGHWASVDNSLTFTQVGKVATDISITYNRTDLENDHKANLCSTALHPSDACSTDNDKDGIPDYRDLCIDESALPSNRLGCTTNKNLLLDAIDFKTGRTYLDVSARQTLDTVAYALLNNEPIFVEVSAHTDNVGAQNSNRDLSLKRANAVRHYLILKGVDSNAIRAVGHGETFPIRDNESPEGRRANRRVELSVVD